MAAYRVPMENATPSGAEPRRVLVVDGDPGMRVLLGETLEREGFAVTVAETGEAVIAAVERTRFDAVVLDKELPDINGLDLVFFLRHRCPGTPVVLIATHGGEPSEAAGRHRGASRYLDKPVRPSDLVAAVHEVAGHRRSTSGRAAMSRVAPRLGPRDDPAGDLWGVVLAGGHSLRLREVTRRMHGQPRPRQDARLAGPHSMLRQTLDRVALEIPWGRTVVAGLHCHARYLEAEFGGSPPPLLLQPRDRGTAAGVLLPAYWIRWHDPGATLAVFPSDHFVAEPRLFMDHVAEAVEFVARYPRWIVLLGAEPSEPETEYGWIMRDAVLGCTASGPVWRVARFVEKPWAASARRCLADGGWWNTGILVAKVATLVDAARQLLPALHGRFVQLAPLIGTTVETRALRRAYAALPSPDFSRAMLEQCVPILAVTPLTGVSWCDLGSPRRLATALGRAGIPSPGLVPSPHGVEAGGSDLRAGSP